MTIRVLHVVQSLDPAWGGIARVVPDLARRLSGVGVESTIATLTGGRYGQSPQIDGAAVRAFPASENRLGTSREFREAIGQLVDNADVVHLHGLWTDQNRVAGAAARRRGKPYIMTPHSMMMPWAWQRSWWKKRPIGWWFEHRNLRRATCLHALCASEAEQIRALGFNRRIETIPNGIDPGEYADLPPADELIRAHPQLAGRRWLLFMSRIHPQKGIAPLMQGCFDAAAALAGEWQLVIAGPDELGLRSRLEAAAARKGLAARVTFVGLLDRRQARAALGRAGLFVQPSLNEGLSMAILEALAAGVPVLISPYCNMPEVAQADAGRIVQPERRPIAAALRELLAMMDDDRRAMGRRGQQLIRERFSWDVVLPQYRGLYERIVSGTS